MKINKAVIAAIILALIFMGTEVFAQVPPADSVKEYESIEEALKEPNKVTRLRLENQKLNLDPIIWTKFTNLEFLSLKNDHLSELPSEIGLLPNLRILELSGNDFELLPESFKNLNQLEELFLNDEIKFSLEKNIVTLSALPKLKVLHLEGDHLNTLPKEIAQLKHLEELYLNHNNFNSIPTELNALKRLILLNIQDNKIEAPVSEDQKDHFGFKIFF